MQTEESQSEELQNISDNVTQREKVIKQELFEQS